jgi:hypothetical protein
MRQQNIRDTVRTDLIGRIDGLAGQRGHLSAPRIHDEVDQIRHIAHTFGFDSVESLAGTLQSALSLHGLGLVVLSYLDLMRDALTSEPAPVLIPLATVQPRALRA